MTTSNLKRMALAALAALLAMAVTTACTADLEVQSADAPAATRGGDSLTVTLRLLLPAADGDAQLPAATRATTDHGIASEVGVKDGLLVLLTGESEAAATVSYVYEFDNSPTAEPEKHLVFSTIENTDLVTKVTMSATITETISTLGLTGKVYALVFLNVNGKLTKNGNELQIAGGATLSTLADIQTAKLSLEEADANGFFMSNAPVVSKADNTLHTLAEVTDLFVNKTSTTATDIILERAAAKITLNCPLSQSTGLIIDGNSHNTARIHELRWGVDHYNEQFTLVRRLTDNSKKDVGLGDINGWYRTTWADDTGTLGLTGNATAASLTLTPGQSIYRAENTNPAKPTRVVVRIKLKSASNVILPTTLYGVSGTNEIYTSEATLKAKTGKTPSDTDVITYTDGYIYYAYPIPHDVTTDPTTYALVRNHHYVLNITGTTITTVGSNDVP